MAAGEVEAQRVSRGRTVSRAVGNFLLPASNPVGTVYGTLAVGILFAAESTEPNPAFRDIVAVVGTLIVYWLAHGPDAAPRADRLLHAHVCRDPGH
ncbi:MAG: hypothetical protein WBW80_15960 [Acidimicrobiales bacterium]